MGWGVGGVEAAFLVKCFVAPRFQGRIEERKRFYFLYMTNLVCCVLFSLVCIIIGDLSV